MKRVVIGFERENLIAADDSDELETLAISGLYDAYQARFVKQDPLGLKIIFLVHKCRISDCVTDGKAHQVVLPPSSRMSRAGQQILRYE